MRFFDIDGDGHVNVEEIVKKGKETKFIGGMTCLPGKIRERLLQGIPAIQTIASNKTIVSTKTKKSVDVAKLLGGYS